MVLQFHDGMIARVIDNGAVSEAFAVTNGVNLDCVLALTLFSLMLSAILLDAYLDERLRSRLSATTVTELLYGDGCVLNATSEEESKGAWLSSPPPAATSARPASTTTSVTDDNTVGVPPPPTTDIIRLPNPFVSYSDQCHLHHALPPTGGTSFDVPSPVTITTITPASSNVHSVHPCPDCDRTLTSRIVLIDHRRIQRTATGEPVHGTPTHTYRILPNRLLCLRTLSRRMTLLGHMRIHKSLW
ncbi:hypothetical protein SprV_0301267500 [Sparganum proliferum]